MADILRRKAGRVLKIKNSRQLLRHSSLITIAGLSKSGMCPIFKQIKANNKETQNINRNTLIQVCMTHRHHRMPCKNNNQSSTMSPVPSSGTDLLQNFSILSMDYLGNVFPMTRIPVSHPQKVPVAMCSTSHNGVFSHCAQSPILEISHTPQDPLRPSLATSLMGEQNCR